MQLSHPPTEAVTQSSASHPPPASSQPPDVLLIGFSSASSGLEEDLNVDLAGLSRSAAARAELDRADT